MNQSDHVTSVIAITVCDVIQKLITKIDFWYRTYKLGSFDPRKSILVIIFRITLHIVNASHHLIVHLLFEDLYCSRVEIKFTKKYMGPVYYLHGNRICSDFDSTYFSTLSSF